MFGYNWGLNFNNFMCGMPNPYMFSGFNLYMARFNFIKSVIDNMLNGFSNRTCNCQNRVNPQPFNYFNLQKFNSPSVQPTFDNSVFENYMARQKAAQYNNFLNTFKRTYNTSYESAKNYNTASYAYNGGQTLYKRSVANNNTSYTPTSVNKSGMFLSGKGKNSQYGPQFLARVKEVAQNLKCDYKDLLAVMNSESGIDAKVVGRNGASGLICFMPQFFDVEKIRKMTPLEQLDLVESTLKKNKQSAGYSDNANLSKADLYALVFLPGRANRDVLCTKGETNKNGKLLRYYEDNAALDYNKDGKITKEEMATRINKKYVSDDSFLS